MKYPSPTNKRTMKKAKLLESQSGCRAGDILDVIENNTASVTLQSPGGLQFIVAKSAIEEIPDESKPVEEDEDSAVSSVETLPVNFTLSRATEGDPHHYKYVIHREGKPDFTICGLELERTGGEDSPYYDGIEGKTLLNAIREYDLQYPFVLEPSDPSDPVTPPGEEPPVDPITPDTGTEPLPFAESEPVSEEDQATIQDELADETEGERAPQGE